LINSNDQRPIYKVDVHTRKVLSWREPGILPGEPVFVGKPHAKTEDEGVILSILFDVKKKRAFLLILDAVQMKEIARVYAPVAIPLGLHGQFF